MSEQYNVTSELELKREQLYSDLSEHISDRSIKVLNELLEVERELTLLEG